MGFLLQKPKKTNERALCHCSSAQKKKNADFDFDNDVKDGLWSKTQLFMVYKPLRQTGLNELLSLECTFHIV